MFKTHECDFYIYSILLLRSWLVWSTNVASDIKNMKSRSLHKEVKKNPKYLLIKTAFYCHNKCHTNGAIRRHFGKQMNKETKLRIHNITAKTVLKFGSEA